MLLPAQLLVSDLVDCVAGDCSSLLSLSVDALAVGMGAPVGLSPRMCLTCPSV